MQMQNQMQNQMMFGNQAQQPMNQMGANFSNQRPNFSQGMMPNQEPANHNFMQNPHGNSPQNHLQ